MGGEVKHSLIILTLILMCGCSTEGSTVRSSQSECGARVPGGHYCGWEGNEPGKWLEVCCNSTQPYCGRKGSECGVGQCCSAPPLDLSIPVPTAPIHGGPLNEDEHGDHSHNQAPEGKGA